PGYPASEGVDHAAESASHLDGTDHPAGSASRFRSVPRHPVLDRTDHASEKLRQEEADGRELSESIPPFRPVARRMESGRTEPLPVMRGPARGLRNNQGVGGACDLSEADPQESARNEAGVADSASVLPAAGETVAQASRERQVRVVGSHGDLRGVRRPVADGFTPPARGGAQEGRTPRRKRKGEAPGGPRARRAATGKRPHLYLVPPLDEDALSGPSRWGRSDGGPVRTGERPAEA